MKITLLALLIALTSISCSVFQRHPASQLNSLSLGMPKANVIEKMGDPLLTKASDGVEYMVYNLSRPSGEYFVQIKDGKVAAFGKKGDFGTTAPNTKKLVIDQHITNETTQPDVRTPAASK